MHFPQEYVLYCLLSQDRNQINLFPMKAIERQSHTIALKNLMLPNLRAVLQIARYHPEIYTAQQ